MKQLALVVAGVVIALGLAAPAGAYPETDRRYLESLSSDGIVVYDTARAINDAYAICARLDAGWRKSRVIDDILLYNPGFYGNRDLGISMMVSAYWYYCPWHRTN